MDKTTEWPIERLVETMEDFVEAISARDGEEMLLENTQDMALRLPNDQRAALILGLLWAGNTHETTDRRLAAEMAIIAGPDWAQWLYHMAVLVTKIA